MAEGSRSLKELVAVDGWEAGGRCPPDPLGFNRCFPCSSRGGKEEPGEPLEKSARPLLLARPQSALGFHPWRALSSAGAKGLFPVSVSLGVYRVGKGKGQVELIAFRAAAEFSLLG